MDISNSEASLSRSKNHDEFLRDLFWAAGFLEGEGSFSKGPLGGPCVSAGQVQKEPLERLEKMFGGSIVQRQTKGFSLKPIWIWSLRAHRSIQVMMTLYTLMSPRRKGQIEIVLNAWKWQKLMPIMGSGNDAKT